MPCTVSRAASMPPAVSPALSAGFIESSTHYAAVRMLSKPSTTDKATALSSSDRYSRRAENSAMN
eukprot:1580-Heterococcus_DN1.PRE.3